MVTSKNALPIAGYLTVFISFNVAKDKNLYRSYGSSRIFSNCRYYKKKMLNNAIFTAIKKEFPTGSPVVYNITLMDYEFTYFQEDYKIVVRKNKEYERVRVKGKVKYYKKDGVKYEDNPKYKKPKKKFED